MGDDPSKQKDIRFVYEKARHHRSLHADGAWAAVTPHAEVQCSFYNDLRRMPLSVTHAILSDDAIGPAQQEEVSDLVREVDVTVIMNVAVAKAAVELLSRMIAEAERIFAEKAKVEQLEAPKVDTHG